MVYPVLNKMNSHDGGSHGIEIKLFCPVNKVLKKRALWCVHYDKSSAKLNKKNSHVDVSHGNIITLVLVL